MRTSKNPNAAIKKEYELKLQTLNYKLEEIIERQQYNIKRPFIRIDRHFLIGCLVVIELLFKGLVLYKLFF